MRAAFDDRLGSTLDQKLLLVAGADQNRHALPVTGEFVGSKAREVVFIAGAGEVDAVFRTSVGGGTRTKLLDKDSEGALGGLSNARESSSAGIIGKLGVVAKRSDLGHLADGSRRAAKVLNDFTV